MVINGSFRRCGMSITLCLRITSKEGSASYHGTYNMCNGLGCAAGTAYMSKLQNIADRSAAKLCRIVGSVAQRPNLLTVLVDKSTQKQLICTLVVD